MIDASLSGIIVCVVGGPDLVARMEAMLAHQPIRLIEARDGQQLIHTLKQQQVDCVLIELQLLLENGLFVQERMRQLFANAPPAIFVGSDADDRHKVAKVFRSGASDYLDGGELSLAELLRSIEYTIRRHRRDDNHRAELDAVRKRSAFDELTGLYSRPAIAEVARRLTATPSRIPFTLLLVRNRQYDFCVNMAGVGLGKQLMRTLATHLRNETRQADVLGRFDDNTIIALLPMPEGVAAEPVVRRLTTALQAEFHSDELSLNLSVAIGAASYPDHGVDFDALIAAAQADLATQSTIDACCDDSPGIVGSGTPLRAGDRRASPRHRVLKSGKIIIDAAHTVIDCLIRDMSEGGVRLRLPGVLAIPSRFELIVAGDRSARSVRRAWQNGLDVGVAFLDERREGLRGSTVLPLGADHARTTLVRKLPAMPREEPPTAWMSTALQAIRTRLGMDVAFVNEFLGDTCMIRGVDTECADPPLRRGDRFPYSESYCKRIVEGCLPSLIPDTSKEPVAAGLAATRTMPIGAHVGVPIRLPRGALFGTLCCFSFRPKAALAESDLDVARLFADFVGSNLAPQVATETMDRWEAATSRE